MLINIHHAVFDGWSTEILYKELDSYYRYYTQGIAPNLSDLQIQYKDFAVWQRSYLTGEVLQTQLDYWRNKLSGFEPLSLTTDNPRPNQVDYRGCDLRFNIKTKQTKLLKEIAKRQGVTLYTVLLSIFGVLLYKYTGQEDIVIGTPIANRHYSSIRKSDRFL